MVKAIVQYEPGGPEVLRWEDFPLPATVTMVCGEMIFCTASARSSSIDIFCSSYPGTSTVNLSSAIGPP